MNSWWAPKEKVFTYLGSEIGQVGESIIVSRENYIEDKLFKVPQTGAFRTILGRLKWLAAQTRPDICYLVSDLLQRIKSGMHFTDASLGNNHDGTTQSGVFILISEGNSKIPLFWQ